MDMHGENEPPTRDSCKCILLSQCYRNISGANAYQSGLFWSQTYIGATSVQSCLTLWDTMDCTHKAPLSMGFSRQGYWSELPCPALGNLPNREIKPACLTSPAPAAGTLPLVSSGKPYESDSPRFIPGSLSNFVILVKLLGLGLIS